jgi:ADP-L-glycero-D-manno-heptose 6-epimerase
MLKKEESIVVTGAAGLIGSMIIEHLNEMGFYNIIAVDDFKDSLKWKNMIGKRYSEFLSRYELFNWLTKNQPAAILHMGANSSTVGTDGDLYHKMNYRFTTELAKIKTRFIYASSAATYGDGSMGFSDQEPIWNLRPLNLYGMSKQQADLWMTQNGYLKKVVGLKFFNVYGPNEYHKGRMASMAYHMYHQIRQKGFVSLFESTNQNFANGEQSRDFIYVKDVARITCEFLFNDATGIYNVGSGEARSFNDMAKALFRSMDLEAHIEYIPMPEDLQKRYQNYTCANIEKLKQIVSPPSYSLESGIEDYLYYLNLEMAVVK